MKLSSFTAGLALIVTGTVIGVGAQQFASADVSSGDRPVLIPIESCRLADTRPAYNVGPRTSPLGTADTDTLNTQQPGTECTGDIPTDATALAANITALNATADGFVTAWADGDRPNGSTLNPAPGQVVFNAATIDLAPDNTFRIYNERGNTDIIVDVIGYYENHDHDDRYYTETEVDAIARVPFAVVSERSTIAIEAFVLDAQRDLANELSVTVPGPGQLIVTATGNYSAILDQGRHPDVQCSLTDDGEFDFVHRSLYEVWNGTPSAGARSEADLAITRVIEVDSAGDVELQILCFETSSAGVLVSSTIIAQYIP